MRGRSWGNWVDTSPVGSLAAHYTLSWRQSCCLSLEQLLIPPVLKSGELKPQRGCSTSLADLSFSPQGVDMRACWACGGTSIPLTISVSILILGLTHYDPPFLHTPARTTAHYRKPSLWRQPHPPGPSEIRTLRFSLLNESQALRWSRPLPVIPWISPALLRSEWVSYQCDTATLEHLRVTMSKIQLLIFLKPAPCADFPDTQETDKNANRKGMVLHYLSAQFFKCLPDLTIPPRSIAASPHQNFLLVYYSLPQLWF